MKKVLLIITMSLLCIISFAQENENKNSNEYVLEKDGSVSFSKIIESKDGKSKEELFSIIENYFTYNYNDGKSVIQSENKEQCYIIGKGVYGSYYKETKKGFYWRNMVFSTPHIIRIDCKDGRVRVIVTVSQYDVRESNYMDSSKDVSDFNTQITSTYPFVPAVKANKVSQEEGIYESAFLSLKIQVFTQFMAIEDAINSGNSVLDNQDW